MSKPSQVADWATTASGSDITAPSGGKQAAGWTSGEFPPHNYFNWWQNLVGKWTDWLDAYESTAHTWSALQTFNGGATIVPTVHKVGGGGEPAFASGMAAVNEGLRFWLDAQGFLHIVGNFSFSVAGGTTYLVFTLPAGYVPVFSGGMTYYRACHNTSGLTHTAYYFDVDTSGHVHVGVPGGTTTGTVAVDVTVPMVQ